VSQGGGWILLVSEVGSERLDKMADLGVLPQHHLDGFVVLDFAVVRIAGEELVLLVAKVGLSVQFPECEEPPCDLAGNWRSASGSVAQVVGLDEEVAVLA
jgi:hypothetical protein